MEVTFAGAAREVTGSCHLVHVGGRTIALDCGMFQGKRAESAAKNATLPLPIDQLDAVVLSHAHIDHSGRLPFLARHGYRETIWATSATRDLCAPMLGDSAHIQEMDAAHLARRKKSYVAPLYGREDVVDTMKLMVGVPYDHSFEPVPGVRVSYTDAGHILGSASVVLDIVEAGKSTRLVFSGDIGRRGMAIIRDPIPPQQADVVIMESTYGNRDHESVEGAKDRLAQIVRDTAARGGRVLIPAFAVGRTQELVYGLHSLVRDGQIPRVPIYIDSPLAIDATDAFEMHPEVFDRTEPAMKVIDELFRFDLVHYTRDVEQSKALNYQAGPMIIIAASGMAESGRILHHLAHGAGDPRNTILIVGFQAENTLGRRIVERNPLLKILGDEIPLRAQVEVLNGYSAHADRTELRSWLDAVKKTSPNLRQIYLVHGEPDAQDALQQSLQSARYAVQCPTQGSRISL